jgi:hypothetical protein
MVFTLETVLRMREPPFSFDLVAVAWATQSQISGSSVICSSGG